MKTTPKSSPVAQTAAQPKKKPTSIRKPARKRTEAHAPAPPSEITDADIATCAYFIYMSEGCPAGREVDHWLEAEARLRNL
jgi:hypothetical protein